jgi:membrane peptidoglycan carboxypeptidase
MCGFVPKLASVVWIGHQPNDAPIYYNNEPDNEMFGSELPSDIWSAFMDAALKDLSIPSMDFPTPKFTGSTANGQFTKATPKKSSSPTPKPDPSQSDQGGHHGHSPSPTPSTSSTCNSWLGCTNPSQSGPPNGQQQNGTG